MTIIGTGNYKPPVGIALSNDFPELAFQNRYVGEYAGLFAIRRMLSKADRQAFIGTAHYRRFILTDPVGQLSGFNFHAHPDLLSGVPSNHYLGDGRTPIIPLMVEFRGSVLCQYAAVGVARDLLLFFGAAVDCGVITDIDAAIFLSGNKFITAGTAAFIPIDWFLDILEKIERVVSHFYRHHHIEREAYLERSMGFCAERLHGLLLAKYADSWGWDRLISQPLTLLKEDGPRHTIR